MINYNTDPPLLPLRVNDRYDVKNRKPSDDQIKEISYFWTPLPPPLSCCIPSENWYDTYSTVYYTATVVHERLITVLWNSLKLHLKVAVP